MRRPGGVSVAGLQTVTQSSGATRAEYSFNDRSRGDHMIATWKLRLATLISAQVIGANRERGKIAPGKLADLVLVDGDPGAQIADIDKLVRVIMGGRIHQPARIEQALGIAPRDRT